MFLSIWQIVAIVCVSGTCGYLLHWKILKQYIDEQRSFHRAALDVLESSPSLKRFAIGREIQRLERRIEELKQQAEELKNRPF